MIHNGMTMIDPSSGGVLTDDKDPELFKLEPEDIHLIIKL